MKLEITDTNSFKQIQEAFNKAYPFLWIDFFQPQTGAISNQVKGEKVKGETALKRFCAFEGTKVINIDRTRSVAQLEADFLDTLCVKIKLLRKSGNVWVETSYTGNWTLEAQNMEGEQLVY